MNKNQFPQKDTIYRINLDNGKFATISNQALLDKNLSSDAFRLLTIILNNSKDWSLVISQAASLIGITDNRKITKIIKCLVDNGYLIQHPFINSPKGRLYPYTISEFGNLKTKSEETSTETIDLTPSQPQVEEEPIISSQSTNNDELIDYLRNNSSGLKHLKIAMLESDINNGTITTLEELKEEII